MSKEITNSQLDALREYISFILKVGFVRGLSPELGPTCRDALICMGCTKEDADELVVELATELAMKPAPTAEILH